jgi:hypothetical protein
VKQEIEEKTFSCVSWSFEDKCVDLGDVCRMYQKKMCEEGWDVYVNFKELC